MYVKTFPKEQKKEDAPVPGTEGLNEQTQASSHLGVLYRLLLSGLQCVDFGDHSRAERA